MVAEKVAYALSQGMKVILCCGETLEQREKNETTMVVARQIKAVAGTSRSIMMRFDSCLHVQKQRTISHRSSQDLLYATTQT